MSIGIGKDIDSWCGRCKRIATHTIIAIVDEQPKQVMCQSCNDRHNYRLEPGTAKSARPTVRTPIEPRKPTAAQRQADDKQRAVNALTQELDAAKDVKPLSRHEVYRSGQIIDHPKYGRGKIENARRDSLLVRFTSGLKSVLIP